MQPIFLNQEYRLTLQNLDALSDTNALGTLFLKNITCNIYHMVSVLSRSQKKKNSDHPDFFF